MRNLYKSLYLSVDGSSSHKAIQIPIFKCRWVKHLQDVEVDDYEFTIVDLRNMGHKDDP
jgi:hypothetical protein